MTSDSGLRVHENRDVPRLAVTAFALTALMLSSLVAPAGADTVINQVGADIDGKVAAEESGYSVALDNDGSRIAVGAPGDSSTPGVVRVYEWSGSSWEQMGSDILGSNHEGVYFGFVVSLNGEGSRVAIGDYGYANSNGQAVVYEWDGSTWSQLGSTLVGGATSFQFGRSLSLSAGGDRLIIGEPGWNSTKGRSRIFDYSSNWSQIQEIQGEASGDASGVSVALSSDGTRVVIGADRNDASVSGSNTGHARVFEEASPSWTQVGGDIDGDAVGDRFGYIVSIDSDGSTVAVGASRGGPNGFQSGYARILDLVEDSWVQFGSDIVGEAAGDRNEIVSLSGDGSRIAVGAPLNDASGTDSGRVRVFDRDSVTDSWVLAGSSIDGESARDLNGWSVAMSSDGSKVAMGAPENSPDGLLGAGHARVFSFGPAPQPGADRPQPEVLGDPGVFLTVFGKPGDRILGSEVLFGAYAVKSNSPYVLSLRNTDHVVTTRVLQSGQTNDGGHLEAPLALPALSEGSHTIVLTATGARGQQLVLGNTISVDADGIITAVTPEEAQPRIR